MKKTPTKAAEAVVKKPMPEATPRYVAPATTATTPVVATTPADDDWRLALRFWWAYTWRGLVMVLLPMWLVQFCLLLLFTMANGSDELTVLQALIFMLITLAVGLYLHIAVVRYMLRKKAFKGFTFQLKKRD